ncbi:MAG: response regulator transcription factor [Sphingobacteriales bacterium]
MKKILVLDDNLDILNVVEEALAYEHFTVKALSSSAGFMQIILDFLPDLVLLDYRLADGNGGKLCRQIKTHAKLNHIPVVIFTAYPFKDTEIKETSCDAVIAKPFDLEEFFEKINSLLTSDLV